ncbi:MAG TPA: tetratricopeptide repeat protein, partial [Myxococcales bacterium]
QPGNTRGLRERARIREQLGGGQAAAADLERVLQLEPNAADAGALRAKVRKLRDAARFVN